MTFSPRALARSRMRFGAMSKIIMRFSQSALILSLMRSSSASFQPGGGTQRRGRRRICRLKLAVVPARAFRLIVFSLIIEPRVEQASYDALRQEVEEGVAGLAVVIPEQVVYYTKMAGGMGSFCFWGLHKCKQ